MSAEISTLSGTAEIAYRGQVPWHGLGQAVVEPNEPVEIWAERAHLTWNVREAPVQTLQGTSCTGWKALIRDDLEHALWLVREGYRVVQPRQLLDFFQELGREGVQIETLGALREGRVIWGLGHIPGAVQLRGKDRILQYLLFATSYDCSLSTIVRRTSVRVVCANTLEAAMNQGKTSSRTTHGKVFDFQGALAATRAALSNDAPFQEFAQAAKALSDRILSREELVQFFVQCLWPKATPTEIQNNARASNQLSNLIRIHEHAPGQELSSARNTAWGALNAVTYLVDHERGRTQNTRMQSALFGTGRQIKAGAWTQALALVA